MSANFRDLYKGTDGLESEEYEDIKKRVDNIETNLASMQKSKARRTKELQKEVSHDADQLLKTVVEWASRPRPTPSTTVPYDEPVVTGPLRLALRKMHRAVSGSTEEMLKPDFGDATSFVLKDLREQARIPPDASEIVDNWGPRNIDHSVKTWREWLPRYLITDC